MSPSIKVHDVRPLGPHESRYVRPLRMSFRQEGKERVWDCIKIHDSVAVILYNVTRSVLLFVKQFRPAVLLAASLKDADSRDLQETSVTGFTLELCAGIMDKDGKSPAETAVEEIEEEVGYRVNVEALKFVSSFRSGVGVSGSLQHLFFCEVRDEDKVTAGGGVEDENIEVVELTVDEARRLLLTRDEDCRESRPASMLFGLSWFFYEHHTSSK